MHFIHKTAVGTAPELKLSPLNAESKIKDAKIKHARAERRVFTYLLKGGRGARPAPGLAGDRRRARARARARAK